MWNTIDPHRTTNRAEGAVIGGRRARVRERTVAVPNGYGSTGVGNRLVLGWGTAREDLKVLSTHTQDQGNRLTTSDQKHQAMHKERSATEPILADRLQSLGADRFVSRRNTEQPSLQPSTQCPCENPAGRATPVNLP